MDSCLGKADTDEQRREMIEYQGKACKLILSEGRKVFDLSQEKKAVRERYGHELVRPIRTAGPPLVEADVGVKFVKIFWQRGGGAFGGWDTHDDAQFLGQGIRNQWRLRPRDVGPVGGPCPARASWRAPWFWPAARWAAIRAVMQTGI